MGNSEAKIRQIARELFADGKIDILVGYEKGTMPFRTRPIIVRSAGQTDLLVWNSWCSNNLAVYLPWLLEPKKVRKNEVPPPLPKIGILAKSCDVRAIYNLIREHQIPRKNVVIIGIPCTGMLDKTKINALCGNGIKSAVTENGDMVTVTAQSCTQEKAVTRETVIADSCIECLYPIPEGVDVLVEGPARNSSQSRYNRVQQFEAMTPQQRREYFVSEMSRCIRCYACRQACPNCYCKECFADQSNPRWVDMSDDLSNTMLYHIGRIFHQAGRCVECDACVRACPMGIDLRLFTQKLVFDVNDMYDFIPGFSSETPPPLCTYKQDDKQEFITEP